MRIKRSSLLVHQILPSEEANPYRHFVTVQEEKQYLLFQAHVTFILLTFLVYCISEALPLVSDILYFDLGFFSPLSRSLSSLWCFREYTFDTFWSPLFLVTSVTLVSKIQGMYHPLFMKNPHIIFEPSYTFVK